jgi:hypothetical protein
LKGCVCDGRSEGPTKAVLSTRKLVQVEVEDIRRSLKVALTPQVGPIRSSPLIFCVLEAQEQCPMRISKVSCSQQPFLLRSRQQRFFSRREGEKSKKRKRPLATSLWGGGPNVVHNATLHFCPLKTQRTRSHEERKIMMAAPRFPMFSAAFARHGSRVGRTAALFERGV